MDPAAQGEQHLPLQVDKVVDPLGDARVAGRAHEGDIAVHRLLPGPAGATTLADQPARGLDQFGVFEKGQMGADNAALLRRAGRRHGLQMGLHLG